MRKLLILLLAAAVIGIIISQARKEDSRTERAPSAIASADHPHASEPAAAPSRQSAEGAARPPAARSSAASAEASDPAPLGRPERPRVDVAEAEECDPSERKQVLLTTRVPAPGAARKTETEPAPDALPDAEQSSEALSKALSLLRTGKRLEARAILTKLYLAARGEQAARLRAVLDTISRDLVFNPRCVDGAVVHLVQPGDVLVNIGKQYGVHWRMIARINNLDPDRVLRLRQQLKILTGKPGLVVYKGEFRMALLLDGAYVREYPIGIGRDDRTPTGRFVVDAMEIHPPWSPPGGGIIRYGEAGYLLGERWIGFADQPGADGLGMHGTNDESSIGTKCSNGCLRMYNAQVVELYDFVQIGTPVEILE